MAYETIGIRRDKFRVWNSNSYRHQKYSTHNETRWTSAPLAANKVKLAPNMLQTEKNRKNKWGGLGRWRTRQWVTATVQ
jgi:hypothetical protein